MKKITSQRCPVLKAGDYKRGFENNLEFKGFRGEGIKWELKTKK